MAKTKKKEEKVVDSKPKKISNEHLNKMQEIINNLNRAQIEIGSIESRKHTLLHHVSTLQEDLAGMQIDLRKEYGTDNINIHTGEINYDEQTD